MSPKATYDSTIPVSGSNPSSYNVRNVLQSLSQGDSEPLRPRAQASPNMTVGVAGTEVESYFHRVYNDFSEPLEFATQNSPTVVAPVSNNRIDILLVSGTTASGTLHWVTGVETGSPSMPSIPEEMLPVCAIYCKTTMDRILNYEEKDTDATEGYIYRDLRPKVVAHTGREFWESEGGDTQLRTADDVDMQTKKLKNLVAGSAAADSLRYDQALKSGDSAGGHLSGTYPNPTSDGIPKVIFTWSGVDNYAAEYGIYVGTNQASGSATGYLYIMTNSDTYQTLLNFKFKKVAGVDTVTIYARLWGGSGGADQEAILNVDINGASATVKSVTSTTPTWVTAADIDVSGLTDGTVYDGIIQLKNEADATLSFCSAVTLIGK